MGYFLFSLRIWSVVSSSWVTNELWWLLTLVFHLLLFFFFFFDEEEIRTDTRPLPGEGDVVVPVSNRLKPLR